MDSVPELWKTVPGFPNYEASSLGRVRSLDRIVPSTHRGWTGTRLVKGKCLKLIPNRGYLVVKLGNNGKITTYGVHQVVAMAFHGLPPAGMVVDHVSTLKTDNRPENLEYVTNSENVLRQYEKGLLSNRGEKHGGAKLSNAAVIIIRKLKRRTTAQEMSERFGVTATHIRRVWKGSSRWNDS